MHFGLVCEPQLLAASTYSKRSKLYVCMSVDILNFSL